MVSVQGPRQVGEHIWFGIGCFNFGYEKKLPFTFRRDDYVRDLRSALESIPAITGVEIDAPSTEATNDVFEVSLVPERLEAGEGAFPYLGICYIRFNIYIPARVQAELANEFAPDDTGTENFRVHINHAYEGPVAFVVLIHPKDGDRAPSAAVRIVREFLRRELNPTKTPIRFECLGPSPFHANCSLVLVSPSPPRKGAFAVQRVPRHGFDLLQFTSNQPEFQDVAEAADALFSELDHELGFFYEVKGSELRSWREWAAIQDKVSLLLQKSRQRGFWYNAVAAVRRSRKLRDAFTSLVNFDVGQTFILNQRNESYRNAFPSDGGFLRSYVDTEIQNATKYPTSQVIALVGFLERRRSKALELGVVLIAAVVGGIAGATITSIRGTRSNQVQHSISAERRTSPEQAVNSPSPATSPSRAPAMPVVPSSTASASRSSGISLQDLLRAVPTPTPGADMSPRIRLQVLDLPSPSPK